MSGRPSLPVGAEAFSAALLAAYAEAQGMPELVTPEGDLFDVAARVVLARFEVNDQWREYGFRQWLAACVRRDVREQERREADADPDDDDAPDAA